MTTRAYILSRDLNTISVGSVPTEAQPLIWQDDMPFCSDGSIDLVIDRETGQLRRKTEAERLEIVAKKYKDKLYEFAEIKRGVNITPGFGQAQAYVRKQLEAVAFLGDSNPSPDDYPILASEVGITGSTITNVALNISSRVEELSIIELCLNKTRLLASKRLSEATTRQELDIIYNEAMLALDSCIVE